MTAPVVLVGGTFSYVDTETFQHFVKTGAYDLLPWFHPRSRFADRARNHGATLLSPDEPFVWASHLDTGGALEDWWCGAAALAYFCRWRAQERPVSMIAHSHGGQVAALAIGRYGVKVDRLVTAGTPVRADMQRHRRAAISLLEPSTWTHIYSPQDSVQISGSAFSGGDPTARAMPEPGVVNVAVELPQYAPMAREAHSALHDAALWTERGWWSSALGVS